MNRQLFSEVFKQISSKIDQLKNFPPSSAHLKVIIHKKSRIKKQIDNLNLSGEKKFAFAIYIQFVYPRDKGNGKNPFHIL